MFGGGSKAHIYISIKQGNDASSQDHYRRAQHVWMISVEPHKTHVPGLPHSPPAPVHIVVVPDEQGDNYRVTSHAANSDGNLLGNILLVETAHASPDDVEKILNECLTKNSSSVQDDSDDWIRWALHVLQAQECVPKFNIDDFMTYAHAYAASRADHEAPALIAYPKLQKDHDKKAKKQGFWLTHPMTSQISPRKTTGGNTYGGLM